MVIDSYVSSSSIIPGVSEVPVWPLLGCHHVERDQYGEGDHSNGHQAHIGGQLGGVGSSAGSDTVQW